MSDRRAQEAKRQWAESGLRGDGERYVRELARARGIPIPRLALAGFLGDEEIRAALGIHSRLEFPTRKHLARWTRFTRCLDTESRVQYELCAASLADAELSPGDPFGDALRRFPLSEGPFELHTLWFPIERVAQRLAGEQRFTHAHRALAHVLLPWARGLAPPPVHLPQSG